MKTYSTIFIALLVLAVSSCNTTKELAPKVTNKQIQMITPVDELFGLMQGSYDSSEQAIEDSTYYDISLHMYPIWQSDTEAKYLYVEQSVSAMQEKPYRQRVYKIVDNMDGTFASYVYKLQADSLYIGNMERSILF